MATVALRTHADKIILGGMGLSNDDFLYYKDTFENAGMIDKIISFINTTDDPPVERLLVPDMASPLRNTSPSKRTRRCWYCLLTSRSIATLFPS